MSGPRANNRTPRRRTPSTARGSQLQFWSDARPGRADLCPTRALERNPSCARVLETVRQVRWFFPELDGRQIRVGLTRAAAGFASREEDWIWINPYRLVRHTIAHELTHLLQNAGLVPRGEKSADLFALARHASLADDVPCYLATPASLRRAWKDASPSAASSNGRTCRAGSRREELQRLLHVTARDAAEARENGTVRYLRWFETQLAERWEEVRAGRTSPLPVATVQPVLFASHGTSHGGSSRPGTGWPLSGTGSPHSGTGSPHSGTGS